MRSFEVAFQVAMNVKTKCLIFCVFLAGVASQTDLEEERCIVQTYKRKIKPRIQKFFYNFASENEKQPDELFFSYCTRIQDSVHEFQNEMIAILQDCMTNETMDAYQKYVKILDEVFNFLCRLNEQDLEKVYDIESIGIATRIRQSVIRCARKTSILLSMQNDFCLVDPPRLTTCINWTTSDAKAREWFRIYYNMLKSLISCQTPPAAGKFAPSDVFSYIDQILLPSYAAAVQMN